MPIYEYECPRCQKRFEVIVAGAHRPRGTRATCPACGTEDCERCWSRVAVGTGRKSFHRAEPADV